MKKLRLKSLASSLLMFTTAYSMESPSSIDIETVPDELKLAIITAQNNQKEALLQYTDIIKLMQTNKYFNEFARNGELWVLLSTQNGFASHPNTAFKCHYNYLKGLKLNLRNPEFKNTALLEESIQCFNKGAPFMHEGAIYELLKLMNSPHVPLETKCIYLPEDLNLETCAFLSEDQILAKSDDDFLELVRESHFYALKDSEKIRKRFFEILNQRDLSILSDLLITALFSTEKGDDCTEDMKKLISNFEDKKPSILAILERAKINRDFITLDLLICLLDIVKSFDEDSDESSSTNATSDSDSDSDTNTYNISPLLEEITKFVRSNASPSQMATLWAFLDYITENEIRDEYEARKTAKSNDIPSPYRDALLSVFRSGSIKPSHFLIDDINWNINLYNPSEPHCMHHEETLSNYFYFVEKEIAIKYPSIICHDFTLPYLNLSSWGSPLSDFSPPVYLRKFLILQDVHKTNMGNIICPSLIDSLLGYSTFSFRKEFDFSPEFWQIHLGFNNYDDFKNDIFKSIHPKLIKLSESIKDRDDLAEIYNLLIAIYSNSENQIKMLNYAEKSIELDLKKLGNDSLVESVFWVFLKCGHYEKAEKTIDLLCFNNNGIKQTLWIHLNKERRTQ